MAYFTNHSPTQLAWRGSMLIAVFTWLVVIVIHYNVTSFTTMDVIYLMPFLIFGIGIFVMRSLIYSYINDRVRMIYKHISATKGGPRSALNMSKNQDALMAVQDEVLVWAQAKEKEISEFKELELFRRNFMGDVSHELKTPIFNILGLLHTLIDGGLNDPYINLDYLKRAARNTERLQTIIEDLETIAKIESGVWANYLEKFELRMLIEEVIDELKTKAAAKKISLHIKDNNLGKMVVHADREKMRQVFINLLDNSIKYGSQNGNTRIAVFSRDTESFLVEITDDGLGIPREDINNVFNRFYRVDRSRSRDQGGSGLGLSIVKHIVEAHGHEVMLRTAVGQGSTFGFGINRG